MTTQEFSDAFDTLLNSYASQAIFGEGASKQEVVLDEYEKSVLLTQAQDIIVKSYFYGNQNPQGQGFDDSIRRQVDFSSLIKSEELTEDTTKRSLTFDDRGLVYGMPTRTINEVTTTDVLFILNEKMIVSSDTVSDAYWYKAGEDTVVGPYTNEAAATLPKAGGSTCTDIADAELNGWSWVKEHAAWNKNYVVVPLNYKEYDREMSKAYAQPFKKQAWRLFQNTSTGFDVQSELIPLWDIAQNIKGGDPSITITYKVRYVKRPDPIVLTNLPNGLTIDGATDVTQCSLNPIVHMDILNKAVEIALSTRGRVAAPSRREE